VGLMPLSSTPGRWLRGGLLAAAVFLLVAAGLFAFGAAREDVAFHSRYAGALDLETRALDAQRAAARSYRSLSRLALRAADAGRPGDDAAVVLQELAASADALAAEIKALRGIEQDSLPGADLARAEEAADRLLALARESQRLTAAALGPQLRTRLLPAADQELETINDVLGDLLAAQRARIDEAARLELRADRTARISTFAAGSLGLTLGLLLMIAAWRSLSTNADLMLRLSQMAREDGLTGVANRRTLDERLPQEMARARRQQYALSVVMIDLDFFKRYNDRRGHAAGDALLRNAAQAWLRQLRPSDLLARYGGEEFTLVLPACDEAQAERMVERLQPLMPERQTFSAGIATWDGQDGPQELLAAADRALLQAKRGGRNRIVVAGREPQISLPLRLVS